MLPFVITGCSGGGKSTLLGELERRGYKVRHEHGREVARSGLFPDRDPLRFALAVTELEIADHERMSMGETSPLFDRSLIDQVAFLRFRDLPVPAFLAEATRRYRYAQPVFIAPPWPEIYENDAERHHDFRTALGEYRRLRRNYARLGYDLVDLPRTDVAARADFVERAL